MNLKTTNKEIGDIFGYHKNTLGQWRKDDKKLVLYNWLKAITILMKNGYTSHSILHLGEKVEQLESKVEELESGIDDYVNKIEALREIKR